MSDYKTSDHLNKTSPSDIRIGLVSAIFVYALYAIVDRFMLPENYKTIWILRFLVLIPAIFLFIYLSFKPRFLKHIKIWLTIFVILGQIGIASMVYIAERTEVAYFEYYVGMTLVVMWAAFVFRLSFKQMILLSLATILFYNIVALGFQRLLSYGIYSIEFAFFMNNNFILISASLLALVGSQLLDKYGQRLYEQNKLLEKEKTELQQAKKKAEESDRLKMSFLSNMSHEIRTPMNSIIGFAEMLKNPDISKLKEERYINIIQSKGKHLIQLINDIIDIARIEANELVIDNKPVDLNNLMDELELTFLEVIEKSEKNELIKLKVEKNLFDTNSIILTDGFRLRQIISNLLSNAVKFTDKGEIVLGYKKPDNDKIILFVKDTGIGISNEKKKTIFERFRQVDENHNRIFGGIGLGLTIVKDLVGLIGGKLWFESEVNYGSTFYVEIPFIMKTYSKPFKNKEKLETTVSWENKKILIAEDDKDNYFLLEEILAPMKVNILWAKSGLEAIEKFDMLESIDLVLMDVKMPEMDGYEALRFIKKRNVKIPVIAQTAYAMKEDIEKMVNAGFDAVFPKPIDTHKLIELIKKYFNTD